MVSMWLRPSTDTVRIMRFACAPCAPGSATAHACQRQRAAVFDSLYKARYDPPVPAKKNELLGTVYLLKRTELAVRSCVEVALSPFRLTPTQFLVLVRLKQSQGMSSAELARAASVRPQSIVDLIGPLERDGLIKRREAPEHRRILRINLTTAGEQLLARALIVASDLEKELLAGLTVAELARLHQGLTKLLASAEVHETHPGVRRTAAAALLREEIARPWRKPGAETRARRRDSAQ
jgi:DNA-binding MarR family transcriptional regulator